MNVGQGTKSKHMRDRDSVQELRHRVIALGERSVAAAQATGVDLKTLPKQDGRPVAWSSTWKLMSPEARAELLVIAQQLGDIPPSAAIQMVCEAHLTAIDMLLCERRAARLAKRDQER